MISKVIILNSKLAKNIDSTATGSRYNVTFNSPIQLNNPNPNRYVWGVACTSLKVWNSIANISAGFNTNKIEFKRNAGDAYTTITIPDGQFNIENINDYIHQYLYSNGFYSGTSTNPVFAVSIKVNSSTSQVVWEFLDPTIQSNPESGATQYYVRIPANMHEIMGFNANTELTITDSLATRSSPNRPNITFDVDQISVNLSIAEGSYINNRTGQSVIQYTPDVPPGGLIQKDPTNPIYLRVSADSINNITVYLLDNLNRPVDLRGEETTITIELKLLKLY